MKRNSLLELLHPDGNTSTSFVLGGNCPQNLFPELSIQTEQEIELFLLAPTTTECLSEGWLESAAKLVNQRLSDDGVCYMLVPPPWRLRTIRLLSQENLATDSAFWHFPNWATSSYLVPLQRAPAQFALEEIVSAPVWKRLLAKSIFRYTQSYKLMSISWKSVGISIRRPGARPLFQWLFDRDQDQTDPETAIVRKSWRQSHGAEILYCFTGPGTRPSAIVKTASAKNTSVGLDREAKVLETLSAGLRTAGVEVPQILRKEQTDQRTSLFLSPVRGRSASDLLRSNPELFFPILAKIVDWLERWHAATTSVRALDAVQLEQDIFNPIERLAPLLQNAQGYRNWLSERIQTALETPFSFVATHNDLTMANVLVHDQDELGVVDWETGMAESWPLVDFYYAVTDAVRLAHGHTSWLGAFKACYQPDGPYARDVECWAERLRSAIGVSSGFSELCFHACWLHHASNEHEVSHPGDPRPFLEIVQWLALSRATSHEKRN